VGDTNHCEHRPEATLASTVPDELVRRHSIRNDEECLEELVFGERRVRNDFETV